MIYKLKNDGLTITDIAKRLDLDRKTVRKYLKQDASVAERPKPKPRPSKLDDYRDYLNDRLRHCPELSSTRLLREVKKLGYTGAYTILNEYVASVRPKVAREYAVRFETLPGQQAQVDFSHFQVRFASEPDRVRRLWLFAMVLGYSRQLWGFFCERQDLRTVVRMHIQAFEAFGGAPKQILYDRMKTAVIGEKVKGEVEYNLTLLNLLHHYGSSPFACQPYRPQTKGKVERTFSYVKRDFFTGSQFDSLNDLNHRFANWCDEVANCRLHSTSGRIVSEAFSEERTALVPLPKMPYPAVLVQARKINNEGMVAFDGNWYSVPDTTHARTVEVQELSHELRIVDQGDIIARHPLAAKNAGEKVMDSSHRKAQPWSESDHFEPEMHKTVARRPLEFYDQVGQKLAAKNKCKVSS